MGTKVNGKNLLLGSNYFPIRVYLYLEERLKQKEHVASHLYVLFVMYLFVFIF